MKTSLPLFIFLLVSIVGRTSCQLDATSSESSASSNHPKSSEAAFLESSATNQGNSRTRALAVERGSYGTTTKIVVSQNSGTGTASSAASSASSSIGAASGSSAVADNSQDGWISGNAVKISGAAASSSSASSETTGGNGGKVERQSVEIASEGNGRASASASSEANSESQDLATLSDLYDILAEVSSSASAAAEEDAKAVLVATEAVKAAEESASKAKARAISLIGASVDAAVRARDTAAAAFQAFQVVTDAQATAAQKAAEAQEAAALLAFSASRSERLNSAAKAAVVQSNLASSTAFEDMLFALKEVDVLKQTAASSLAAAIDTKNAAQKFIALSNKSLNASSIAVSQMERTLAESQKAHVKASAADDAAAEAYRSAGNVGSAELIYAPLLKKNEELYRYLHRLMTGKDSTSTSGENKLLINKV